MTSRTSWMPPRWLIMCLAAFSVAACGYVFWWRYAAGLLESQLTEFSAQAKAQGVTAQWEEMVTSGFPARLRSHLIKPRFENPRASLSWEANGLTVEMLPWSMTQLNFAARGPQALRLGPTTQVTGEARESGVSLMFRADGMPKQLDIAAKLLAASLRQSQRTDIGVKGDLLALHWRIDPDDVDPKDGQDFDAAINAKALTLTGVELPFGPEIADIKLEASLRGVPALQGVDGAMDLVKWRAGGAPVAIRKLTFVSGGVDIQGAGELALSANGVVQGQLNLMIGGLDKIVALLSKQGAIPPEAKSTLFVTSTMLSATGAKVPMPLIFKDGKTHLGPVQIGPAPRLVF